eukprot:TRINITY_DN12163_c0_g1_i1.p1 TRINITY_DN12163_c0_g1~~TRINITY_DN12163_c0_g1_i1.p1  ORF type:complete len:499 (+),score=69.74 TRINITY_DN12163_c0_g1_i1:133-1629(+)
MTSLVPDSSPPRRHSPKEACWPVALKGEPLFLTPSTQAGCSTPDDTPVEPDIEDGKNDPRWWHRLHASSFSSGSGASSDDDAVGAQQLRAENQLLEGLLQKAGPKEVSVPDERLYWESFFVLMPMFCGYAALFGMQDVVKHHVGISDDDYEGSQLFCFATSFLYIGNLVFRLAHAVVLGWTTSRGRVFLAMTAMFLSQLVILLAVVLMRSRSMVWVFLAYALGGMGIGCFEGNFLNCLTPLGNRTKRVAILGIPLGLGAILIGGFFLLGIGVPFPVIQVLVMGAILIGMAVMCACIPTCGQQPRAWSDSSDLAATAVAAVATSEEPSSPWRPLGDWARRLWHYPLAQLLDGVMLSAFCPGVLLFIFDKAYVDFALLTGAPSIKRDLFFVIVNAFNMCGSLAGRWTSYHLKPRHPIKYAIFLLLGAVFVTSGIAELAPFGCFFIMLADGLIYGTISRQIDASVPQDFNLFAISSWLFVGDLGTILGSNLISSLRFWIIG